MTKTNNFKYHILWGTVIVTCIAIICSTYGTEGVYFLLSLVGFLVIIALSLFGEFIST